MTARRRELVHRLPPLDGNTCKAEELSESMEQWFVGIFYLLEAGEAAVARGTQDFFRLRRPRRQQEWLQGSKALTYLWIVELCSA